MYASLKCPANHIADLLEVNIFVDICPFFAELDLFLIASLKYMVLIGSPMGL
jgi:hypothetical protein